MRRLLVALVVAAVAALGPTWALAGNQEVAVQIRDALKNSGQMHGFRIEVKFQDGTAWLKGHVSSREQLNTALQIAFRTPGVTRIVNNLTITEPGSAGAPALREPDAPGQRLLQQSDGAIAAEQLPRLASREIRGPQMPRPVIGAEVASQPRAQESPRPMGRADRVPTAFSTAAAPQVSVTGLQEPTLAPPQQAEGPQPVLAQPAIAVPPQTAIAMRPTRPLPIAYTQGGGAAAPTPAPAPQAPAPSPAPQPMAPIPAGPGMVQYDHPNLPNYAWPAYAAYPNYAAVTYPKQYSPTAWPYIGPFYPYPQVPLGWRKVTLEWHDGWWNLNFDDGASKGMFSGLFRPFRR